MKRKAAAAQLVRSEILVRRKEGFDILKKKKESRAAMDLRKLRFVPGGMDNWMDRWMEMKAKLEEEEAARPVKKRKRVVKQRMPKSLIDHMVAVPFTTIEDLTPAQLEKRTPGFRQLHALTTFVNAKMRDYEQALIDQYNALGYAEDETEVTDNEEDNTTVEN